MKFWRVIVSTHTCLSLSGQLQSLVVEMQSTPQRCKKNKMSGKKHEGAYFNNRTELSKINKTSQNYQNYTKCATLPRAKFFCLPWMTSILHKGPTLLASYTLAIVRAGAANYKMLWVTLHDTVNDTEQAKMHLRKLTSYMLLSLCVDDTRDLKVKHKKKNVLH